MGIDQQLQIFSFLIALQAVAGFVLASRQQNRLVKYIYRIIYAPALVFVSWYLVADISAGTEALSNKIIFGGMAVVVAVSIITSMVFEWYKFLRKLHAPMFGWVYNIIYFAFPFFILRFGTYYTSGYLNLAVSPWDIAILLLGVIPASLNFVHHAAEKYLFDA